MVIGMSTYMKVGDVIHITGTKEYYTVTGAVPMRYRNDISVSAAPSTSVPSSTSVNMTDLAPSPGQLIYVEAVGIDGGYYPYDSEGKGSYIQVNFPVGTGRFGPKGPIDLRQIDAPKNDPFKVQILCRLNTYPTILAYNYLDRDVKMEVWFFGDKLTVKPISKEEFDKAPEFRKKYLYG